MAKPEESGIEAYRPPPAPHASLPQPQPLCHPQLPASVEPPAAAAVGALGSGAASDPTVSVPAAGYTPVSWPPLSGSMAVPAASGPPMTVHVDTSSSVPPSPVPATAAGALNMDLGLLPSSTPTPAHSAPTTPFATAPLQHPPLADAVLMPQTGGAAADEEPAAKRARIGAGDSSSVA
uniref:Uncharacterized protein n=1 Tax=Eutreptiella gymnastica TaxID=73025 RepID=A0A6U7X279_9EUGL